MDLVGKKIKGFKFENRHRPGYALQMDNYIGKVGTIIRQDKSATGHKFVEVRFSDGKSWNYITDEIEKHLVGGIDIIPLISNPVTIEVSDDNKNWYKAEVLIQLPEGDYVTTDLIRWKFGREIQKDEKKTV